MRDREPADIVLVVDGSRSMRNGHVSPTRTRWQEVRDTAKTFAEGILSEPRVNARQSKTQKPPKPPKPPERVQLAAVVFGSQSLFSADLGSSATTIYELFFNKQPDDSGNSSMGAALNKANEMLRGGRSDAAKYIVLITDGSSTTPSNDAVLAAANQRPEKTKLFVVNMGDPGGTEATQLKQLAQGAGGLFHDGRGLGGVDAAFRKIILEATIKNLSYTGVTVTDHLSEYVKPVGDGSNPQLTLEAVDGSGNSVKGTDKAANRMTANYDTVTRTLTLGFEPGTKLTKGVTYRVMTTIEPSDMAHQEYARTNGQYPHKGDSDTDAPNKNTSSGKEGFYSNKDAATLTYSTVLWTDARDTVVDSQQSVTYGRPVIQVKPTTLTLVAQVDNTFAGRYGAKPSHWNLSAMNGQGARNPMTPTRQVIPAGSNEPDATRMATQTTLIAPGSYSLGYQKGLADYLYYEGYDATWICVDARAGGTGLVGSSGSSDPGQHEMPLPDPSGEPPIPFNPDDFHFPSHSDTLPFDGDLSPGPFSPPRPDPVAPDPGPGNNLVLNTVDNPQITVKPGQNAVCTVTFKAKPGKLTWHKVDEHNALLGGSHWSLTSTNVDGFAPKAIGDNGNEDEDKTAGKFGVKDLIWGDYRLVETKAPDGYTLGKPLAVSVLPVDGVMQEGSFFTVHAGSAVNHKTTAADAKPGKPGKPDRPSKPGKPGLAATGAWVTGGVTVMMLTLAAAGAVLLVRRKFMH
ncbi:DUF7604 domain-containing protein [Bifidobacterium panos]|nr:VWA domain-containing protein [Bifidobacterium sp. DSM 109963]